jgi:hypothetical protein
MDYEPVAYRGIDFVLKTRKSAKVLTDELTEHVVFDRVWKGTRTIVISCPNSKRGVESEINCFCDLVERLSREAMVCWNACSSRLIDIGIDSGNVLYGDKIVPLDLQIGTATLKRISDIKGKLVITVYPYVDGTTLVPAAIVQR